MIYELTKYIIDRFYKHLLVKTVKYQQEILINAQPNNRYFEVVIDNQPILNSTENEGVLQMNYNIIILGNNDNELTIQDNALHIGLDVIYYLNTNRDIYPISVEEYSFVGLSSYTDDNASGVRLSLTLSIPSPINLCEDNFDEDKDFSRDSDFIIDLNPNDECTNVDIIKNEENKISLNPIKLK